MKTNNEFVSFGIDRKTFTFVLPLSVVLTFVASIGFVFGM